MPKLQVPLTYPFAAPQLRSDLERLAGEVYKFGQVADRLYESRPAVSPLIITNAQLAFGGLHKVDPRGRTLVLTLPKGRPDIDGGSQIQIEQIGPGTIQVVAPAGSTIDGSASLSLTQIGLVILRFDGANYYSTGSAPRSVGTAATRYLAWRGAVHTMSPTFRRYTTVCEFPDPLGAFPDQLAPPNRTRVAIIEPGFPGVATELQIYRYGPSGMPTFGPSGVVTHAGQWIYSLEKNGNVVATGQINTGVAHGTISLSATFSYFDQLAVRVTTPTGKTWIHTQLSHQHVLLKVRED